MQIPTTPEEAQRLLAEIGAGKVKANTVMVSALRRVTDSIRRDGTADDDASAGLDHERLLRQARAAHERRFLIGGGRLRFED